MKCLLAMGIACLALVSGTAAAAEPFYIGVIAPTSGPVATVGARQLDAMKWWQQDVNGKGGIKGRLVELVTCDDQANPELAVTCTRNLIDKHVVLILNSSVTGPVRATLPLVVNGPVMIVASPAVLPEPSTFVFQGLPTDLDMTRALYDFLRQNDITRVAMIAATDATGEVAVTDAKKIFGAAHMQFSLSRIDLNANDASVQLANVMSKNPQVLYSSYSGGGAITVVKSFTNLGLTIPLVVNNANATDAFIAVVKNDMPPVLMSIGLRSMVPEEVSDPKTRERIAYFEKSFLAWKHEPADQLNELGLLLADIAGAVLQGVPDPADPKADKSFLELTPIESVQTVRYSPASHIGLTSQNVVVVQYNNGHWAKAELAK